MHNLANPVIGTHFMRDRPAICLEKTVLNNNNILHASGTTDMESVHIYRKQEANWEILQDSTHPQFCNEAKKWFKGPKAVGIISLSNRNDRTSRVSTWLPKKGGNWMKRGLSSLKEKVKKKLFLQPIIRLSKLSHINTHIAPYTQ